MTLAAARLPSGEVAAGRDSRCELHRAGDGALETTVDQALIRGLGTAFRVFVSGLFRCLEGGRRAEPGHVVSSGVPLRGSIPGPAQSNAIGLACLFRSPVRPDARWPRETPPFRGRSPR